MPQYVEPTYPQRLWPAEWTGELLSQRFSGETPWSAPSGRDHLRACALALPNISCDPVAFPTGPEWARARAAVGMRDGDFCAVTGIMPGHLAQLDAGERAFDYGLFDLDRINGLVADRDGRPGLHRIVGAVWSFLSRSDATARRIENRREEHEATMEAAR